MPHVCLSDDIHKARHSGNEIGDAKSASNPIESKKTTENTRSCHRLVHFCCFLIEEQERCDTHTRTHIHLNQSTLLFTRFTRTGKNDINTGKVTFMIWLL